MSVSGVEFSELGCDYEYLGAGVENQIHYRVCFMRHYVKQPPNFTPAQPTGTVQKPAQVGVPNAQRGCVQSRLYSFLYVMVFMS